MAFAGHRTATIMRPWSQFRIGEHVDISGKGPGNQKELEDILQWLEEGERGWRGRKGV